MRDWMNAETRQGAIAARWMNAALLLLVCLCLAVLVKGCDDDGHMRHVFAQTRPEAQYRLDGGMSLPDPAVTPGAVNPDVVADLSGMSKVVNGLEVNICAQHFSAKAIRKTITNFEGLKKKACEQYGVEKCDGSVEGDHLVSIELGGCKNCLANLWPQPMDEARQKDHQVEDVLPRLVCTGEMTLADAQKCISTDWVQCWDRVKSLQGGPTVKTGPRAEAF